MDSDKHETSLCPRCGTLFVCKANRINRCECSSVRLSPETVEMIRQTYSGCLCITCLEPLQAICTEQT